MKTILVPTDFSEFAENAMLLAAQLAQKVEGKLILLHVIEPIKSYIGATDGMYINASVEQKYIDYLNENAQIKLQEVAKNIQVQGIQVETAVKLGTIYTAIQEYQTTDEIDLIVMGTRGASGIDEVLIGSNTEKIVRTAQVPVLTVREKLANINFQNMVFATNFEINQAIALQELQKLQALFDAHIHILYVNVPNDFYTQREIEKKKNAFLQEVSLQNHSFHIYSDLNEENGIIAFAEDKNMDMIAVATHQRTGLAHLISGSIAEDVVNHAKIPVITFGAKYLKKIKTSNL
jgi:nucleotide-binding universal stress UspA family protein